MSRNANSCEYSGSLSRTLSQPQSRSRENETYHAQAREEDTLSVIEVQPDVTYTLEYTPTSPSITEEVIGTVQLGQMVTPKSQYSGYHAPLPISSERTAIAELRALADHDMPDLPSENEFTEFDLTDFTIYMLTTRHQAFEMRALQHLNAKLGHSSFLVDGVLSYGDQLRYVQGVPFNLCSIGNYGTENHTVGSEIWIQSDRNTHSHSNIYYRLRDPSPEYRRYHDGFLWVANLGKHFVDFCEAARELGRSVSICDFRSHFSRWLKRHHWASQDFQEWYKILCSDDFRRAVAVNISHLFKESIGINEKLRSLPIWNELLHLDSVQIQPMVETATIVTPLVYECFKNMRFGHHLKVIHPSQTVNARHAVQERTLDLTNEDDFKQRMLGTPAPIHTTELVHEEELKAIKVGDVLAVTKDEDSVWKDEKSRWTTAADDCWYVYVQGVRIKSDGTRSYDALWLYKPSDTSCAKMKYPFPNELFLSDNCTCARSRISENEILSIVPVEWACHPSESKDRLFIRQTYLENERFVTLVESHKMCVHLKPSAPTLISHQERYPVGQTVLAFPRKMSDLEHELDVYEVDQYILEDRTEYVMLRHLRRRQSIDHTGRPNELVYTEKIRRFLPKKIQTKCYVRFYSEPELAKKRVPAPYSRDGTGNAFYITHRLVVSEEHEVLRPVGDDIPQSMIQGFNPDGLPVRSMLRGLDLYCGGGNFGRGLEEGGAIRNEWAVDLNKHAIHTYAANLKRTDTTQLWYGSVNDMLAQALQGKKSNLVPLPGDVDFISAGSPCQGFSRLNDLKNNEIGLQNQSMVASVAAYIDFYRPKYGLLENVMTMASNNGSEEDVLSQLICSIVAMGYQVQIFVIDAWSCGGPQSRTRLFVSFAAPGMKPLEHPALSHAHPQNVADRGIGKLANGQPFGRRAIVPTPFPFITARMATEDLPWLGDAATFQCTEQPDHLLVHGIAPFVRHQIETIPRHPYGMGFAKFWNDGRGMMNLAQRALFPSELSKAGRLPMNVSPVSRAWTRVHPEKLFPIVSQTVNVSDGRQGATIHWSENRMLTVMEARRIQGFPDNEVLPGTPFDGWRRLGNSVSRQVSLALGLAVREVWFADEQEDTIAAVTKNSMPADTVLPTPDLSQRTYMVISDDEEGAESVVKSSFTYLSSFFTGNSKKRRRQSTTLEESRPRKAPIARMTSVSTFISYTTVTNGNASRLADSVPSGRRIESVMVQDSEGSDDGADEAQDSESSGAEAIKMEVDDSEGTSDGAETLEGFV